MRTLGFGVTEKHYFIKDQYLIIFERASAAG
jgi:hypothetical protein